MLTKRISAIANRPFCVRVKNFASCRPGKDCSACFGIETEETLARASSQSPSAFLDRLRNEPAASTVVVRHNSEGGQGRLFCFAHAAALAEGINSLPHHCVAAAKEANTTLAGE
jgi:hypothetical protein